jgi:hypothetical protein
VATSTFTRLVTVTEPNNVYTTIVTSTITSKVKKVVLDIRDVITVGRTITQTNVVTVTSTRPSSSRSTLLTSSSSPQSVPRTASSLMNLAPPASVSTTSRAVSESSSQDIITKFPLLTSGSATATTSNHLGSPVTSGILVSASRAGSTTGTRPSLIGDGIIQTESVSESSSQPASDSASISQSSLMPKICNYSSAPHYSHFIQDIL